MTIGSKTNPLALRQLIRYSLDCRRSERVAGTSLVFSFGISWKRPLGLRGETQVLPLSQHDDQELADREAPLVFPERPRRSSWLGILALTVALAPALSAVWAIPWFVTQDGPAHLYNARILADSFDPDAPSRAVYTISWKPIPNWIGHLVLAGLVSSVPAWVADRIMTSMTLAGLAAAVLWLRWRVAGTRGMGAAALLGVLLAMNLTWLLGFTSFLLGTCLFPITLGIWWTGRYRLSVRRIVVLAALLTLGYFCHLVSLGLTVVGLVVLSVTGPIPDGTEKAWPFRLARLARTSMSFIPLFALAFFYLRAASGSGPLWPVWGDLPQPWLPSEWVARLGSADPITLAIKDGVPFTSLVGAGFILFAPVLWLAAVLVLWWYGRITGRPRAGERRLALDRADRERALAIDMAGSRDDRQGWLVLAALLLVGGVTGPESFGAAHGEFLPQRVVLLGFMALVPVFDLDRSRWCGRAALASLVVAVSLQSAIVWDFGLYSERTAGQIIRAGPLVGRDQRIVTLLVKSQDRFRANPLLHAENWLGVDTGNVIWNNYEALHYYFPVQFRPEIKRPHAGDLERASLHEGPKLKEDRKDEWEKILSDHAGSIDVILIWKRDEELEAITKRWFDLSERTGDVQIYRRRRARA